MEYKHEYLPLSIDKGIILKVKDTSTSLNPNEKNFIFELNKSKFEIDKNKIK